MYKNEKGEKKSHSQPSAARKTRTKVISRCLDCIQHVSSAGSSHLCSRDTQGHAGPWQSSLQILAAPGSGVAQGTAAWAAVAGKGPSHPAFFLSEFWACWTFQGLLNM